MSKDLIGRAILLRAWDHGSHSNVLCATYHVLGRLRRISANYSGALDVGRADKARRQIDKKNVRQAAVYVLEERAADRDRHGLITESTTWSTLMASRQSPFWPLLGPLLGT